MTQPLEIGDIVLCTVDRIVGTIVFMKIDQTNIEGTIILSEIAPGRIRNIRDYVVPKKKIICKVLRISGDRIDLSLRRVTPKEQKEIRERYKQEKSNKSIIKTVLGDRTEEIANTILKEESLSDFLQEAKENPKELKKIVGEIDAQKILDILKSQKQKKYIVKKEILLTTTKPNGLALIKSILGKIKDAEVKYISAGKYSLKAESEDAKKADNKLKEIISEIEQKAKKDSMTFSIAEK
ncbi:MAG: hypothetical protein ABIA78_00445 [archaeon]